MGPVGPLVRVGVTPSFGGLIDEPAGLPRPAVDRGTGPRGTSAPARPTGAGQHERQIAEVSQEFEAIVLRQLLRDLRKTATFEEEGGVATGLYRDLFDEHLAEQLAIVGVIADGILGGDRFASRAIGVANADKHRLRKRSVDSRVLFPDTPDADNGHPQHRVLKCTRARGKEASDGS